MATTYREWETSLKKEQSKRCTKCNTVKPLTEFHKDAAHRDGLAYWCKPCVNERFRKARADRKKAKVTPANLDKLFGVTIKPGHYVTMPSRPTTSDSPENMDTKPPNPLTPVESLRPSLTDKVTCRQWLNQPVAGHRLFRCANGRYEIESVQENGHSPQFYLWHLASEHREAQSSLCDAKTMMMLLSFIDKDVIDAPGTILTR